METKTKLNLAELLPLLDSKGNPINQAASEKLRVSVAELDGWLEIKTCTRNLSTNARDFGHVKVELRGTKDTGRDRRYSYLPNYPTSLDDIATTEMETWEKDPAKFDELWEHYATLVLFNRLKTEFKAYKLAFLTPAERTIVLILVIRGKAKVK